MVADTPDRRIGVFSDIHANYPALKAVIDSLDSLGVESIYCCGDVVGYGPHPNECCNLLKERQIPTIVGNHDHAAIGQTDTRYFNDIAREAIEWTAAQLTQENIEYLSGLPTRIDTEDCLFVHSSPVDPEKWNYILTMGEARQNFEAFDQRICFIGHSHQPFVVEKSEGDLSCPTSPVVRFSDDRRYLINVGSVGQPRDRNPQSCFVVLDLEKEVLELRRESYEIGAVQQAIIDAGLPVELGERLAHGW